MKVLIPPLDSNLLAITNKLIDHVEFTFPVIWVRWAPGKVVIRIKSENVDEIEEIGKYLTSHFKDIRWYVYNEEAKTETIINIVGGKLEGEYKLPLFPEDYKF